MKSLEPMLNTHPRSSSLNRTALLGCLRECHDCATACTICADACLGEEKVQMLVRCIRLNLDCADVCDATGRVLARQTEADLSILRVLLQACAHACEVCGAECARHADMHEHCRVCAESCRRCAEACNRLLQTA
jgi:hypothetical protein